MKRLLLITASMAAMLSMQAQVVESDFDATDTELSTTEADKQERNSGFSIDFRIPSEGVFGYSAHYTFADYFNFGWFQDFLKTDGLESNSSVGVFGGFNYRHWVMPSFFVEGQAGLGWYYHSFSYKEPTTNYVSGKLYTSTTTKHEHKSYVFGYFWPRVGVKVYEKGSSLWCVTVGYRFDALDFKTSKDMLGKYFTFGAIVAL